MYTTESSRWQALQRRDHAASSSFIYAVISTKIYCRPGCPSRLARRSNVLFFDNATEAASAGYRPCLRCRPAEATFSLSGEAAQRDVVRRTCEYIVETKGRARFADVAKHVGLSTRYLYTVFKTVMGTTPARYAASLNPEEGMEDTSKTTSAVSEAVSPWTTECVVSSVDMVNWNDMPEWQDADFSTIYQDADLFLHHDDNCGYTLAMPEV